MNNINKRKHDSSKLLFISSDYACSKDYLKQCCSVLYKCKNSTVEEYEKNTQGNYFPTDTPSNAFGNEVTCILQEQSLFQKPSISNS